ncbi:hypothetical protein V6R85_01245 [Agrobacterium sp. CCNWLW32]|uniref:hypothetical protein n=1 Tax=Agrobacterium sp. CCNWLW32 TaxID=3122072 RepID=UPI00300F9B54
MKTENPPVYCLRRGDTLIGEMEADREWIRQQPHDMRIKVELRTGRSPQRLRFYWAFLGKVVKATECAPTAESLHALVKMETGFTTPIKVKGYTVLVPASVSFGSMSEPQFEQFLENAIRFIAETFGVTPEQAFSEAA